MSRLSRFQLTCLLILVASFSATPALGVSTVVAFNDTYHCLENRQKFISLRAMFFNPSTNAVNDPDGLTWGSVTSVVHNPTLTGGQTYQILGTPPNISYVPPEDWTGTVTFDCSASYGLLNDTASTTVVVSDTYTPPYGIKAPSFGITESAKELYGSGSSATYDYSDDGVGAVAYRLLSPSNEPYTHYVNGTDSSATDTSNPHGSPTTPRKTVPSSLAAGSVVVIAGLDDVTTDGDGADYGTGEAIEIVGSGTSNAPIFIRGETAGSKPTIRQGFIVKTNYVIFENFDFDCSSPDPGSGHLINWIDVRDVKTGSSPDTWDTYDYVAVRHCLFRDYPTGYTGGIFAVDFGVERDGGGTPSPDNDTDVITNGVAYDLEVRNFGDWQSTGTNDYGGVGFHANTKECWALDSHLHHIQSSGVGIHRSNVEAAKPNQAPARGIYCGRNFIHHVREYPINNKLSVNMIASQNKLWRVRESASSQGNGVFIGNQDANHIYAYSDNIWLLFNEIYDCQRGVQIYTQTNADGLTSLPENRAARVYLIGNIFHYCLHFGAAGAANGEAILVQGAAQTVALNNTIYKCNMGVSVLLTPTDDEYANETSSVTRNNAIVNTVDNSNDDAHFWLSHTSLRPYTTLDYNLHYGNLYFKITSDVGGTYTSVASVISSTEFGDNSVEADPDFVSSSTFDFHPDTGSPLIDAGAFYGAYDEFNRVFGNNFPSIKHDYDGNAYSGCTYSIGAFKE